MRDLNLKEMMTSRESHLIMKALTVDVDELGSNGTQKDDVDILISRLNNRKASIYREWREVTNDFDLDKIKRIILGVERDGKVNLIVKQIIKEYKTLVNARKIGMKFMKEYLTDSDTKFELIPFEEILDDYLQQRRILQNARREENFLEPAEIGLSQTTENTLLKRTLDENRAIITQQRKKIEDLEKALAEHEKAVSERSNTIMLLHDKLYKQDKQLTIVNQQVRRAERQSIQDQQAISTLREHTSKLEKENASLRQETEQNEPNITILNSEIKKLRGENSKLLKENKALKKEFTFLEKLNSTQEKTITQLRQQLEEAESTDLFLSAEEANTVARMRALGFKGTSKELLDSIRHEEEIMTIEALESKNRELVQKMNELLEEKGNTTVKIEDIIKGLKKIPNPVEQLLVMEKLGFYVFVNTPLGEQIRELIEEMCKNQQEIQNKQNIMINQLVTGNGTQNITNANMAPRAE
ncbi:MAG: hypothetical protein ACFNVZ_09365 [Prevotella melaninogenica]